jgi:hypothetical protein
MDWRNPFEDFRDKYLSFGPVKAYKLWVGRWGYIPYDPLLVPYYDKTVLSIWGDAIPQDEADKFTAKWDTYVDMKVVKGRQPWITKFFNAALSIHIGVSYPTNRTWLKLPFLGVVIRWSKTSYFQFGGIFGPEGAHEKGTDVWERSTICGKFRFGEFKKEYLAGGNYDVYGFFEGVV